MWRSQKWASMAVVTALCMSGCAFKSTRLRKQAARDFGCHTFGVKVSRLEGDNRYLARGCHQEAEYELDSNDYPVMIGSPRPLQPR